VRKNKSQYSTQTLLVSVLIPLIIDYFSHQKAMIIVGEQLETKRSDDMSNHPISYPNQFDQFFKL